MATGRTLEKYTRLYANGYDLSGVGRSVGPLLLGYGEADLTAWTDQVKGYLRNHPDVNLGTFNAVFDNTATTGIHTVLQASGEIRTVLVAKGIRAAPAAGDPAFGGQFTQKAYQAVDQAGALTVTIPFSGWAADAGTLLYAGPWGVLLHANSAETAANTGTGHDNPTAGATAKGGYFIYHVLAGDAGTVTLSVDDSADNAAFLALSGATSGSINATAGTSGIVAIGNSATVRRYLRWQAAFGTSTTCTFVSAFMRAF